ncbi:G-type lectin S-receptor-like serine/threonine-protein kinase [Tripterygium wilfordii]|uniref:G-type lectin S-receptor-like serine/threonine-protein kinase n=1 Tax=Tripterygium wilfordii TaxID=458696 RepID=A0A7J7DTB0_TRIWF|nr:G-type lectin S-receptor-like serine/threonine-protein kinase [Tripterygium wilfordii]
MILTRLSVAVQRFFNGKKLSSASNPQLPKCITPAVHKLLDELEKPIRFSSLQLKIATQNFSSFLGAAGAGAYGAVYKGELPGGFMVAVKVLNGSSDKKIEDQFLAEVSTIGRTHHINLVLLYGFCFEKDLRALVYEFLEKSSLDRLLFNGGGDNSTIEWESLHNIAVGTARGIAYLHEECQQRIIHYDIKPENILLNSELCPKVSDFGLAKLCNREKTHMTLTEGGRGTPGYAAPEMWMPFPVSHKCDVYSFGMLLFEILGRRRNMDENLPESQEWFPKWVWKKFEKGEFSDLMVVCRIEDKDRDKAERMAMVALWSVQYLPELRPWMSHVVKMLEGGLNIPRPRNPFQHLTSGSPRSDLVARFIEEACSLKREIARTTSESFATCPTPTMQKYEIEIATL